MAKRDCYEMHLLREIFRNLKNAGRRELEITAAFVRALCRQNEEGNRT